MEDLVQLVNYAVLLIPKLPLLKVITSLQGIFCLFVTRVVLQVGWSIEASTLEKPQPWPRISRVFEAEGQIFLHFRGPIEAEGS